MAYVYIKSSYCFSVMIWRAPPEVYIVNSRAWQAMKIL